VTLPEILEAVGAAIDAIPGLHVYVHAPDVVAAPAAIVELPQSVEYDAVWGRGADVYKLRVLVLVARGSAVAAHAALADYMSGAGPRSVKAAVEGSEALADGAAVRVDSVGGVGGYSVGGTDYAGCRFALDAIAAP
jgi:hypothetical protein